MPGKLETEWAALPVGERSDRCCLCKWWEVSSAAEAAGAPSLFYILGNCLFNPPQLFVHNGRLHSRFPEIGMFRRCGRMTAGPTNRIEAITSMLQAADQLTNEGAT